MKICSLIENTSAVDTMHVEHGLSLYIETANHNILFDAGQSGIFVENAAKMGIDLRAVDFVVLSHGHYDHGGGLKRFLEINDTAPIYLSRHAFTPLYNADGNYIGLDPTLFESDRLIFTEDMATLDDGLFLYSCNEKNPLFPADNFGLTMTENTQQKPDDFRHEQYLLIEENGKKVLISGCSHKGILNIETWFQPDILIGGFHFMKLDPTMIDDAKRLHSAAEALLQYPTIYTAPAQNSMPI